jgi:hypothetical protein
MLTQNEFINNIVEKLQKAGIEYVICGSTAATFYGLIRSTQDTDIIINPTREQLIKFIELLGKKYYISSETAFEALNQGAMFNVIDIENSFKADLIIRKPVGFSVEEFRRKRKEKLLDKPVYILSPEDSILSKLAWAKQSRSETQYRDVMTILEAKAGQLDVKHLKKWAKILEVEDDLNKCLERIQKL